MLRHCSPSAKFAWLAVATLGVIAASADPASAACPTEGPVTCTRYQDRLVVDSAAGRLMLFGAWSPNDGSGRFHTDDGFTIGAPGGIRFPVPGVESVSVTCSPYFAIEGDLTGLPSLSSIWPDSQVEATLPKVSMGMALGEQIDVDLPVDPCSPYLYFTLESSMSYSFGGAEVGIVEGDSVAFLLDPWDPGFIIEAGGQRLSNATGNFVQRAGMGVSKNGDLQWESAVPLPTGFGKNAGQATADIAGHVWATGKLGFIPIPNLPVQLTLDGDVVVDLGSWPKVAEHVLGALASGEVADIPAIVAEQTDNATFEQIMNRVAIGANVNSLAISTEFFSLDLARGALVADNGRLRFAAEAWTPGEGLVPNASGIPLLDAALNAIVVKARLGASGYVDADGYRFELRGNFKVGPLTINNATLVIDSDEGVRVNRGDLDFDPVAFVEQLKSIFNCDFARGLARCTVGGFPVLSANATIQGGDVEMGVKLDLFGMAGGEFALVRTASGDVQFELAVSSVVGMFGFPLNDARLTLSKTGFAIEAAVANVFNESRFKGSVSWQGGQVRFTLGFKGKTKLAGFPRVSVDATLSNAAGPVRLSVTADFQPSQYDSVVFSDSVMKLSGDIDTQGKFTLSGQGQLTVHGYPLASLAVTLSNNASNFGFSLDGRFDAEIVHVALKGSYRYGDTDFVLSGTSDLTVSGHTVASAGFTLSRTEGLVAAGRLALGVMSFTLKAQVTPTGAVTGTAQASFVIPIYLNIKEIVRAAYCVGQTISNAGQCTGEMVFETVRVFGEHVSCGMEPIWSCTEEVVSQVTDILYKVGSCIDGAVTCGTRIVTDGTKCGFSVMAEKLPLMGQCVDDWIRCVFTPGQGQAWCEQNPPSSCLAFAEPKTCEVAVGCDLVKCEQLRDVVTPAVCTQVGEKIGACFHDEQVQVPQVCNNVVAPQCYPEEAQFKYNEYVGYLQGTVSLTLGTTMAATVSGAYQDVYGNYASWQATGSVDIGASGGQLCMAVPAAALPAGALFTAFAGSAQICSPL